MKKLLIIAVCVLASVAMYGQYEDVLPFKASSADTDTMRVLKNKGSALMLKSVLFQDVNLDITLIEADVADLQDTSEVHRSKISALEVANDSTWDDITVGGINLPDGVNDTLNVAGSVQLRDGGRYILRDGVHIYSDATDRFGIYADDKDIIYYNSGDILIFEDIEMADGESIRFVDSDIRIRNMGDDLTFRDKTLGAVVYTLEELVGYKEVSYTTCQYGDTTNITIADMSTAGSLRIHYFMERDMTVVLTRSGYIDVQYDPVTNNVYYAVDYLGTDLGVTIEADRSGTNVRLNIIVDGSLANNAFFDYKIISKFYK